MADRRPRRSSSGREEKPKTPRPRKKPANARAARRKGPKKPPPKKGAKTVVDPSGVDDAEFRYVQPYQATKTYRCPGCGRDIPPGTGHIVGLPPGEPDLRRHWHRGCWDNRLNLR